MQLFGLDGKPGNQPPPMNGFVNNYVRQTVEPAANYIPESIMHHYDPSQVPVISQLAKQFAVCDQWFSSAPCQTWPNRFFLHTSTAGGYENNSPSHFPYLMNTIFNRLNEVNEPWGIYFHDFPQTLTLTNLWPHLEHFHSFDDFKKDARNGELPSYSFIEPRYFPDVKLPNDQHPPHNVGLGEELIADVYNAVRSAPTWQKTLLIIIYDEHGGCYDHVPPPLAVPPDNSKPQPFGFDRYGVRVPAVLISPYIKPGTVLRAAPDGDLPHNGPPYPFDHTSVIATIRKCFNLGGPLTNRDSVAPDLESVLNLDSPTNNGPASVTPLPYVISNDELQAALNAPLNGFQKAMHEAAAHLPPLGLAQNAKNLSGTIESHIENLVNGAMAEVPDHKTPAEALPFMKSKLRAIFGV
ncbi:Non-hemolytic phospholipase C precursor [mine drainage metagenome]|uniref:Non-hemolytic phospholipase C n=1 Tax=mine drainage metagenome TaxID=410659 RepID=A0A1J5QG27_9ZZZZ